jgi:hypothetical protein
MDMNKQAFELAGKVYTFQQVADEFTAVQDEFNQAKDSKEGLGVHFLLMVRGKDLGQYLELTTQIEQAKGWKSAQNKEGKDKAPDVWKQYKSNGKKFLELGGVLDQEINSTHALNDKLQELRKAKADVGNTDESAETVTTAIMTAAGQDMIFAQVLAKLAGIYGMLEPDIQAEMLASLESTVNEYKDYTTSDVIDQILQQAQADHPPMVQTG